MFYYIWFTTFLLHYSTLFEDPMTFPIGCDLMSKEDTDYFKTIYILYNSFTQSNILELGMTKNNFIHYKKAHGVLIFCYFTLLFYV